MRIVNVVGARPNFMKIAPLMNAYREYPEITPWLVHTGQHYDRRMSELFFDELGIPKPDVNLNVGSGSHAVQTAEIMKAFESAMLDLDPDVVLVVGDVNSTIACGLVASKLGIKLVHVEAGLRSFDRSMPEEVNRILTDTISDLLFCTEASGVVNLKNEGVPEEKIYLVGNVMIDTLLGHLEKAQESTVLGLLKEQGCLKSEDEDYAVLTLHRPSNVDDKQTLVGILQALTEIQKDMPIIFPAHPRTQSNIVKFGLEPLVAEAARLRVLDAFSYLDFLKLQSNARILLTDSGGIQEEATVLKVPCLTLRKNTERPVTLSTGANCLVGSDRNRILEGYARLMNSERDDFKTPPLWDGNAAVRTVETMLDVFSNRPGVFGNERETRLDSSVVGGVDASSV